MRLFARLFVALCLPFAAHAATDVPVPLEPWRAWVMHEQEFHACPLISGHQGAQADDYLCAWPGVLALAADAHGASLVQRWRVDAESWIPLPGDAEHWPQQVSVDGQPGAVVDHDGPALRLAAGSHEIRARIPWIERPQTLRVPESIGLLTLAIDGKPITPVQRDGEEVTLGRAAVEAPEADSLQLRVYRRLDDGVPARLATRIELAVSGQAREELIGPALPPGFDPLSLASTWPARLDADGRLRVRVQPGSDTLTLEARALAPIAAIEASVPAEPWPQQEIWSYAAVPQLRVSVAEGEMPVDPAQAQVPADWAQLPAFALADGATLSIGQRSRGQDPDAQNQLRLEREMWLDFDGRGWFARDRVRGRMLRDWRLDVAPPYALERAQAGNDPLLVTRGAQPGSTGVEWRSGEVDLGAGLRIEPSSGAWPVAGWRSHFDGISATVHLPDGYRLLAAPGADFARGSWVSAWTLYDVFVAAVLALLAWRLFGLAGVLVALAYLVLGYQEDGAPRWILLAAFGLALALRAMPAGRLATAFEWARRAALALLVLIALPFVAGQMRAALHPQLEGDFAHGVDFDFGMAQKAAAPTPRALDEEVAEDAMQVEAPTSAPMPSAMPAPAAPPPPEPNAAGGAYRHRAAQQKIERYSESTVLQTGSGEPGWARGQRYELGWSGRVVPEQTMRLLIAPSWLVRLLRVLLVALLAWLVVRLLQPVVRAWKVPPQVAAALLVAFSALAMPQAQAQAFPPAELLEGLRARLTQAPRCAPACAAYANAEIGARGDEIRIVLEAHALERVALPLPSGARDLELRRTLLDGAAQDGLARVDDALWLTVPRGVHRIELAFVAASDKLSLDFPLMPPRVAFDGDGWEANGIEDAHLLTRTLSLVRTRSSGEQAVGSTQQFSPYVRVERTIDLGLDWSVETEVTRLAPREGGFTVAVPLLEGEHVTSAAFKVENARIVAALGDGMLATSWQSKLDKAERLTLVAPPLGERAETWIVQVGPSWHLESSGVPEVAASPADERGTHRYEFHPLPGEKLELAVTRPEAAQGASRAIDAASLVRTVGQRGSDVVLTLRMRASRGGEHAITLPAGAELTGSSRDGQALNLRVQDGRLSLPLVPGTHVFEVRWRDDEAAGLHVRSPALSLGLPAANIDLGILLPQDRWLLATSGPATGPAVLYWSELIVALLLAAALGRSHRSPLKTWQWLLLALGFSTFSWLALLVVAAWLFALDLRARSAPRQWVAFNLAQVGLPVLTLFALLCLLAAVQTGLLGTPDMAVVGNGSHAHALRWFADRSEDALPIAHAISLPLWVHKIAMLAWALWLASALVGWLRRGFEAWSRGGYWRRAPRPVVDVPQVAPPAIVPSEPAS
ncbi:MAG: hypothetical protein ACTHK2_08475 [Dokdonella sp.]|uniref:hypothetical protein n=1 Tax=Dokdonella sp. TaxID=2291710 RepID=UPI003F7CFD1A